MLSILRKLMGGARPEPQAAESPEGAVRNAAEENSPQGESKPLEPRDISIEELKVRLQNPDGHVLLDVREDYELQNQGWIPGSLHIPMNQVPDRIGEIGQDKDVYVVCLSGMRSFGVGSYLLQNGYERVYNVAGGFSAWDGETERAS